MLITGHEKVGREDEEFYMLVKRMKPDTSVKTTVTKLVQIYIFTGYYFG